MFCGFCGSAMEETYNVCPECGTKKGSGKLFCEQCGCRREDGMIFCSECGNRFADQDSQVSAPISSTQTANQQSQKFFCCNCGSPVMINQAVCTKCGVKVGQGKSFCRDCGAAIMNPQQVICTNCGMSLKKSFDASGYFGQYLKNFLCAIDFSDSKKTILNYGVYYLSVIVFILSFLPNITQAKTVSISSYIFSSSQVSYVSSDVGFFADDFTSIGLNKGFVLCGVLLICTIVLTLLRFEPHIHAIVTEKKGGRVLDMFVPALEVSAIISAILNIINLNSFQKLTNLSVRFSVCGWILISFVIISVIIAVAGICAEADKEKLAASRADFISLYAVFVMSIITFFLSQLPITRLSAGTEDTIFDFSLSFVGSASGFSGINYDAEKIGGIMFSSFIYFIALIIGLMMIVPQINKFFLTKSFGWIFCIAPGAIYLLGAIVTFINYGSLNSELNAAMHASALYSQAQNDITQTIGFSYNTWGIIFVVAALLTAILGGVSNSDRYKINRS